MSQDNNLDLQFNDATTLHEDEERARVREEYRLRLAEKLKDPEFRKIEGFPIGTDEAILALSDPPYYTACPNPFIKEWLQEHGKPYDPETDDYHREPFAADVSEGKNDPIYNAHSYHTKVPHKAIMRYILHYTEPGDVVYDGFCGTGMTGVAAQMCGNKAQVESLGYIISSSDIFDKKDHSFSKLGGRKAILNDLSPAATFIAYNYNTVVDATSFTREARQILVEAETECGWMYITLHNASADEIKTLATAINKCQSTEQIRDLISKQQKLGRINYTVWSDVFVCPQCGNDIIFCDSVIDKDDNSVFEFFTCKYCNTETSKRQSARAKVTHYDDYLGQIITQAKRVPVLINYNIGKKRYEKKLDDLDRELIEKIETLPLTHWFPICELPQGYNTDQPRRSHGLTHVHHFYPRRSLRLLSFLLYCCSQYDDSKLTAVLTFLFGQWVIGLSKLNRYSPYHYSQNNRNLNGTLYVGSQVSEVSPGYAFTGKLDRLSKAFRSWPTKNQAIICCQSTTYCNMPDNTVDYIFTDPPFGGNLMYSELNFLRESWHGVNTNNTLEAITSDKQFKMLPEYQQIMTQCFSEYFRVLKPGRWMTVEFHNSSNVIYNAILESLAIAGFIIADVRVLDKKQYSFKQVTTTSATKQDLVLSCYKTKKEFSDKFKHIQGTIEGVIEFVRQYLSILPIHSITPNGKIEINVERTLSILYDKMLAYHIMNQARIPISAAEFNNLLNDQFVERDDMYFLFDQAAKYDAIRSRTDVETSELFISDERSAVQWVRRQLMQKSVTLGELTPSFMQELHSWAKHEEPPELRDLLKVNFITDEEGKWRVPDPEQEKDLEALRLKSLLKTFESYVKSKKPLKVFRKEAILEGFKHCWQTKQYGVIVAVCENIPVKIFQEVAEFVQFYDITKELAPAETQQLEFSWEG